MQKNDNVTNAVAKLNTIDDSELSTINPKKGNQLQKSNSCSSLLEISENYQNQFPTTHHLDQLLPTPAPTTVSTNRNSAFTM